MLLQNFKRFYLQIIEVTAASCKVIRHNRDHTYQLHTYNFSNC